MMNSGTAPRMVEWEEAGQWRTAEWPEHWGLRVPSRLQATRDTDPVAAYRQASAGTGLIWRGPWAQGREVLAAMGRHFDQVQARKQRQPVSLTLSERWQQERQTQALRLRILQQWLVELDDQWALCCEQAMPVAQACLEALGPAQGHHRLMPLRHVLGMVSAHEWRKKGVPVAALGAHIHPHYGVFAPVRSEYLKLLMQAPLPAALQQGAATWDIGTGTGVIAACLARRGVRGIVATDVSARALACARDNLDRLGLSDAASVQEADLFPVGQAGLVVCNPPWVPGPAHSSLDQAVLDPDSRMLRGFLQGLRERLCEGGEGWLILSDLAEHLGLRTRTELLGWIADARLQVLGRLDIRPEHPRSQDAQDPLHAARRQEVTSLWRLGRA